MSTDKTGTETKPDAPEPEPKQFSQSELNEIIAKRLQEDRAAREREAQKERDRAEEARRIAALEGEERIKAEYEAKLKEQADSLASVHRELAVTRAQSKLVSAGLPVDLAENVLGKDDAETDARIAALSKTIADQVAARVQAGLNHGTPPAGAAPSSKDSMAADLDRIMGINRS